MRGTNSEVGGMFSATRSMKTEYESRTVMPSVTFSPASGGRQNANRLRTFNEIHGRIMLSTTGTSDLRPMLILQCETD